MEVQCSLVHNSSQRKPMFSTELSRRDRIEAVSTRAIGMKKRLGTTFTSHAAQNLEADDGFEQVLH